MKWFNFLTQLLVVAFYLSSDSVLAETTEAYRTDLPDVLDESGWELALNEDGIQIFTRDWPGSNFVAIKAVQMIQSSLSNIVGNFSDIESFPEWVKDMESAYVIEPFNDSRSRKIYMRIGLPWPLQDREMVSGQQQTQDAQTKIVKIREWYDGDAIPRTDGVIRIARSNTEFVLIPEDKNLTKMVWQGHNEPGGLIPSFLVNWIVEDVLHTSMMTMQNRFEVPEFHKEADWVVNF